MGKAKGRIENWPDYYDRSDILKELLEEHVHFSLDPELQKEILAGSRTKSGNWRPPNPCPTKH